MKRPVSQPYGAHNWHPVILQQPQLAWRICLRQNGARQSDGRQEVGVQPGRTGRSPSRAQAGNTAKGFFNAEAAQEQAQHGRLLLASGTRRIKAA